MNEKSGQALILALQLAGMAEMLRDEAHLLATRAGGNLATWPDVEYAKHQVRRLAELLVKLDQHEHDEKAAEDRLILACQMRAASSVIRGEK